MKLSEEEIQVLLEEKVKLAPPIGLGVLIIALLAAIIFAAARGASPRESTRPLLLGALGVVLMLMADIVLISPLTSSSMAWAVLAIPVILVVFGARSAVGRLAHIELIRVECFHLWF